MPPQQKTPEIDYDALAEQARRQAAQPSTPPSMEIDYDALAAQARRGQSFGDRARETLKYEAEGWKDVRQKAKEMVTDPTTILGTIASFTPGGYLAQAVGQGIAATAGERYKGKPWNEALATGAMNAAVPVALKKLGGPVARFIEERVAPRMMQGALKPPIPVTAAEITRGGQNPSVMTNLREGLNVSRAGRAKAQRGIDAADAAVTQLGSSVPGTPIRPAAVASHVMPTRARFARQANPDADVAAIDKSIDEWLTQPATTQTIHIGSPHGVAVKNVPVMKNGQIVGMTQAPVTMTTPRNLSWMETQGLKQGTFKQLGDKAWGELGTASTEAQKSLGVGMKEELEAAANRHRPGLGDRIAALNEREGNLIQSRADIAKRLAGAGNRDIGGLNWMARTAAAAGGFMATRSPALMSSAANKMYGLGARQLPKLARPEIMKMIQLGLLTAETDKKNPTELHLTIGGK